MQTASSDLLERIDVGVLGGEAQTEPVVTRGRSPLEAEVLEYLTALTPRPPSPSRSPAAGPTSGAAADVVFETLTHRDFSALSRSRTGVFRERATALLQRDIGANRCLTLWYDIGPGYRASLHPGMTTPSFTVGLGELLMLGQVAAFIERVGPIYAPGARFVLIVDNLCALATNDIPVARTEAYCAQLRSLVDVLGLAKHVNVLVESEQWGEREYFDRLAQVAQSEHRGPVSARDVDNVARFLGRACCGDEAADRVALYRRTSEVTESFLAQVVDGIRLTQRPTDATLGFRSFPGGDARLQSGDLSITRNAKGRLVPLLLTSRNVHLHRCTPMRCLPEVERIIPHVLFAEPAA